MDLYKVVMKFLSSIMAYRRRRYLEGLVTGG